MVNDHPFKEIVKDQKKKVPRGVYSICSANEYVIEAAIEKALEDNSYALIEATANQVNQFGGYTGMNPDEFSKFTLSIAHKVGLPEEKVILGGDHLGPLTWQNENSKDAMGKSCELIRQYVLAGFTKIHLDTSMYLLDDCRSRSMDIAVIAQRGAILCKCAQEAYAELKKKNPLSIQPVYVIGSEVPIPGGAKSEEEGIKVTKVSDFEDTVEAYRKAFEKNGLNEAWQNVIAVVVQPGVEFGDAVIHDYNREAASALSGVLNKYTNLIFEGHSTDYQTAKSLRDMVTDGIAILKVGPALTFALREALFALNYIENELFKYNQEVQLSNFIDVLETAMLKKPDNWKHHYHGDALKVRYARKYSFSDRCRYYLPVTEVKESINLLIHNLRLKPIPLTIIDQFMPIQATKLKNGLLKNDPEDLLKDRVKNVIEDYSYACKIKRGGYDNEFDL